MIIVVGFAALTASAGGFFLGGVGFGVGSLIAQGDFVGFGNQNLLVTLTGSGTVRAICENQGGNQSPGRNPIFASVSQSGVFTTDQNGRAPIVVESPDPTAPGVLPSPSPKTAGCPNGNWTVIGFAPRSTNWTSAVIKVQDQATGQVVFQQSYACVTSFDANGMNTGVTCTPN